MNSLKEKTAQKKKKKSPKGKWARNLVDIANGNFLTKEIVVGQLPFIFYLTFLAICYIANTYYAERTEIERSRLTTQIKELTSEYVSAKSEYSFKSKRSEVLERASLIGLQESETPPATIFINQEDLAEN